MNDNDDDDDDNEMANGHANALDVPAGAHEHPQSSEILRAWITGKGLEVSMVRPWEDPDNWGIFLVDIARHAARIYEVEQRCGHDEAMNRIKDMFEAEWERPADEGKTTPEDESQ